MSATPEVETFFERGWARFPADPAITAWVRHAAPLAWRLSEDPALRDRWLRYGGTWFAGVNLFPNDARGAVPGEGVPPLGGRVLDFVGEVLGFPAIALDPAQISVCYPGYPAAPSPGETEAAFRFRRDRDAAHVDGLIRDAGRRRSPGEMHAFILGIPLEPAPPAASPMVVWEGSHEIMRRAFRERLGPVPSARWRAEDVTDAYVAARRTAFETCPRVTIHAMPGECYLLHRLALHGVAPWGAEGGKAPRPVAYFRPDPFPDGDPAWWLDRP